MRRDGVCVGRRELEADLNAQKLPEDEQRVRRGLEQQQRVRERVHQRARVCVLQPRARRERAQLRERAQQRHISSEVRVRRQRSRFPGLGRRSAAKRR